MRLLGFDTATVATTVAVLDTDGATPVELRDDPPRGSRPRHTSHLMPLIARALEQAGLDWGDLDRLAVGVGPGTFTGLRIGIATGHALARATGLPLVGVPTLRSLALGAQDRRPGTLLAAIDARRGEVFAAAWAGSEPLLAPAALGPDALVAELTRFPAPVLAIGDGAVEFREILERSGATVPEDASGLHLVRAINHCRLASAMPTSDPAGVQPEYIRLPDAEIARQQ